VNAIETIKVELRERLAEFQAQGKLLSCSGCSSGPPSTSR